MVGVAARMLIDEPLKSVGTLIGGGGLGVPDDCASPGVYRILWQTRLRRWARKSSARVAGAVADQIAKVDELILSSSFGQWVLGVITCESGSFPSAPALEPSPIVPKPHGFVRLHCRVRQTSLSGTPLAPCREDWV